ncbi:hypothetical protein HA38_08775 [Pantoea allii]|nr:hypothetical protein HA38_08775 [Pantoea allii]
MKSESTDYQATSGERPYRFIIVEKSVQSNFAHFKWRTIILYRFECREFVTPFDSTLNAFCCPLIMWFEIGSAWNCTSN